MTDKQKLKQIQRIIQIAKNTNTFSEAVINDIASVIDGTFKYWSHKITKQKVLVRIALEPYNVYSLRFNNIYIGQVQKTVNGFDLIHAPRTTLTDTITQTNDFDTLLSAMKALRDMYFWRT